MYEEKNYIWLLNKCLKSYQVLYWVMWRKASEVNRHKWCISQELINSSTKYGVSRAGKNKSDGVDFIEKSVVVFYLVGLFTQWRNVTKYICSSTVQFLGNVLYLSKLCWLVSLQMKLCIRSKPAHFFQLIYSIGNPIKQKIADPDNERNAEHWIR